jgi:hypothetical protein
MLAGGIRVSGFLNGLPIFSNDKFDGQGAIFGLTHKAACSLLQFL